MIGWIIAGAIAGAILVTAIDRFWDSIAGWLNSTAADAVERVLGYNARKFMQKAVTTVTKVHDRLHNKAVVYTRQSALDTVIHKVTLSSTAPVYDQEDDVKNLFERESTQVNTFEYRN